MGQPSSRFNRNTKKCAGIGERCYWKMSYSPGELSSVDIFLYKMKLVVIAIEGQAALDYRGILGVHGYRQSIVPVESI